MMVTSKQSSRARAAVIGAPKLPEAYTEESGVC